MAQKKTKILQKNQRWFFMALPSDWATRTPPTSEGFDNVDNLAHFHSFIQTILIFVFI